MEIVDSRLHGDDNNKIEGFKQSQVKIIYLFWIHIIKYQLLFKRKYKRKSECNKNDPN